MQVLAIDGSAGFCHFIQKHLFKPKGFVVELAEEDLTGLVKPQDTSIR